MGSTESSLHEQDPPLPDLLAEARQPLVGGPNPLLVCCRFAFASAIAASPATTGPIATTAPTPSAS